MFDYITNSDLYISLMKLNEICEVYSGYAIKEFNNIKNGLPVIKIWNIQSDGTLNLGECQFSTEDVNEKYHSNKDDIYIALSGATTGKLGIMEDEKKYIINQRVGIIRFKQKSIYQSYIKYYLLKQTKRIIDEATGCAQPNISPKQIGEYDVPVFPEKEMLQISNILNNIERVIKHYKAMLEKYDDLIKARFVEMFGEIDDKNGWPRNKWEDVVTIKNGKDYKNHLIKEGGYPVYGTGGEMCRVNKFLCPENTVIVGRKGSINNPLLVKEKFWNVDTAFGVIPDKKVLNYLYFYEFCRKFDFMKLNKATTLPSTTKADLLKIEINIPPIDLQNQFADFVKQVDKSKLAVQQSLEKTQQLFDSLMQEYFG